MPFSPSLKYDCHFFEVAIKLMSKVTAGMKFMNQAVALVKLSR